MIAHNNKRDHLVNTCTGWSTSISAEGKGVELIHTMTQPSNTHLVFPDNEDTEDKHRK